jgi:hypothetical protein
MIEGWRALAAAVLRKAIRDATRGDTDAASWLYQDGADLAALAGIDAGYWYTMLSRVGVTKH